MNQLAPLCSKWLAAVERRNRLFNAQAQVQIRLDVEEMRAMLATGHPEDLRHLAAALVRVPPPTHFLLWPRQIERLVAFVVEKNNLAEEMEQIKQEGAEVGGQKSGVDAASAAAQGNGAEGAEAGGQGSGVDAASAAAQGNDPEGAEVGGLSPEEEAAPRRRKK